MEKKVFGEGDSYVIDDILPKDLAIRAYKEISEQTKWNAMLHKGGPVPRLISVQGKLGTGIILDKGHNSVDGTPATYYPLYRHPADVQIPCVEFLPVVDEIARHISGVLGQDLNHVLVQYYRTGDDIITEHSDKTLDIVQDTVIVNVSLGYTRTMTLRTKKNIQKIDDKPVEPRMSEKVVLQDNSLFVLGPSTNQKWLHGIRADKTETGRAVDGSSGRISLTFRSIGTFVTSDGQHIFGQGVKPPAAVETMFIKPDQGNEFPLQATVTDDEQEISKLYQAFSTENKTQNLTWSEIYNPGSNVIT